MAITMEDDKTVSSSTSSKSLNTTEKKTFRQTSAKDVVDPKTARMTSLSSTKTQANSSKMRPPGTASEKPSNPSSSTAKKERPPPPSHKPPSLNNGPGNSNGDKLANANKCNNVRQKSFAKTDEKKAGLPTTSAGTAQTTSANARNKQDQMKVPRQQFGQTEKKFGETDGKGRSPNFQRAKTFVAKDNHQKHHSPVKSRNSPPRPGSTDGKREKQPQRHSPQNPEGRSPSFQRQRSFVPKENNQKRHGPLPSGNSPQRYMDGDSIKERRVSPQNAESRSPNFQRQKSFMTKEVNQKCHGPMTSGNSPPPRSPPRNLAVSNNSNWSPRFKRTRTISCIDTTGVQNRNPSRNRSSNSFSENQTDLHKKKEIPGIHPKKTAGFSDQEKGLIFDAMQPPSVVMKSKARILIDVSDVLFKTVLTHRVAPSDATLITFKILEIDASHTFVESLINSSQDYYKKMTSSKEKSHDSSLEPLVLFLCELYQVIKQMSVQIESDPGSSPSTMILDILADFCRQFLLNFVKKCDISTQNSKIELFAKVFTMIGKDISGSSCLTELMHHLRDAFLCSHSLDEDGNYNSTLSRKKLLHLIELQSGDWQLSPDAVNYYSSSHNKGANEFIVPNIVLVS